MTVKQLVEILRKLPADATVFTQDGEGHEYCVIKKVSFFADITEDNATKRVLLQWGYDR